MLGSVQNPVPFFAKWWMQNTQPLQGSRYRMFPPGCLSWAVIMGFNGIHERFYCLLKYIFGREGVWNPCNSWQAMYNEITIEIIGKPAARRWRKAIGAHRASQLQIMEKCKSIKPCVRLPLWNTIEIRHSRWAHWRQHKNGYTAFPCL